MLEHAPLLSESDEDRMNRLGYVVPEREEPGTLGHLIVDDPADPFNWLTDMRDIRPSEAARDVMWMLYRMSGNFPAEGDSVRTRDDARIDRALKRIDTENQKYIDLYQKHLVTVEAKKALVRIMAASAFDE